MVDDGKDTNPFWMCFLESGRAVAGFQTDRREEGDDVGYGKWHAETPWLGGSRE